ncbi:hypothetical protein ATK36_2991 [Amycolatopsis sulphurea]|uniref:Uncharacterized protein n=1 Tax=Amycolatopsis sulphurea TaxID=76022 RepID=A0A2A9FBX4_9PSEU|nr:hypothetical protein [Amycolatopsis sulphurea]PFG47925.1 hypothetical protein ATK36_2991 [Amycolatopsis sulphurea]
MIDGVWHVARPAAIPAPGDEVVMPQGATAVVKYAPTDERTNRHIPMQCPYWDAHQGFPAIAYSLEGTGPRSNSCNVRQNRRLHTIATTIADHATTTLTTKAGQ